MKSIDQIRGKYSTTPPNQKTTFTTLHHTLTHNTLSYVLSKILARLGYQKHEEGFSLVLVLWFLVLLGLLGANLLREARATHYVISTNIARLQAQAAADGAINFAIQNLLSSLGSAPSSLGSEFTNIRLFDRDVAVKIEDEGGKIDITTANFPLLSALMQRVGVSPSEADLIAENAVAWRLPQNTTMRYDPDEPYSEAGHPYGPRHGPFRAVPELRLVLGMTDLIQAAVAPVITIWSDHAGIDRGVASDTVLGVLAAAGDSLAISEMQRRKSGSDVGTSSRPVLNRTFSIIARVTSTNVAIERRAVIRFTFGKRKPYVVLDWS
jgi:general secretion pathway protein K